MPPRTDFTLVRIISHDELNARGLWLSNALMRMNSHPWRDIGPYRVMLIAFQWVSVLKQGKASETEIELRCRFDKVFSPAGLLAVDFNEFDFGVMDTPNMG